MREFTHSLTIEAPPAVVLDAFFDHDALSHWWHVTRSLCVARPLGVYAVEWDPTVWRDDVLGRLGGEPVGPMAFEARCTLVSGRTVLHVRQSGWENSVRWSRYYDVISTGLTLALDELKKHVERRWNE